MRQDDLDALVASEERKRRGVVEGWFVHCETGCSCCRDENHYRGPYASLEDAERRRAFFQTHPILGSQYAPKGRYCIGEPCTAELLPDGRVIIESRVFPGFVQVDGEGITKEDDRVPFDAFGEG